MIFIHFTISKVDENHNAHTHTPILKIGVCVFVLTGTDWENVFAVPTGVSNSIEKASNIIWYLGNQFGSSVWNLSITCKDLVIVVTGAAHTARLALNTLWSADKNTRFFQGQYQQNKNINLISGLKLAKISVPLDETWTWKLRTYLPGIMLHRGDHVPEYFKVDYPHSFL